MRIVRLDELDDEERQQVLKEQNQRLEQNNIASQQLQQQANVEFNNNIKQNGAYVPHQNASNIASQLLRSTGFITKKTGVEILSGTAGIIQSGLTETANNANKGEKKNILGLTANIANSILGLTNPIQNINNTIKSMPSIIGQNLKTITDKNKTGLEKIVEIGLNANTNAINNLPTKNFMDSSSQLLGKINPNTDEALMNVNNKIQAPINKMNAKLEEESQNYGKVTNLLANAGGSIGNMVPSIAVSALTGSPSAGLATMGLSAKGQATQEALNKGADLENAIKIGNAKGMIEVGTEMLTGGVNIFGKGALDDIVEKGILDKVKNNVAKFLVKQGLNASGEVLEETISDIAGNLIDKGTVDPNASYSLKDWSDTAISTVLTTTILNVLTGGMAGDINQIKQDNQANQNAQDMIRRARNIINENQDNQLINEQTKNVQNGMSQEQKFEYKQSDNQKVNSLREDASKYLNNTEESINYINTLEKIIQDKDIDIRLDPSLTDENGQIANGKYKNGVITINPNSDRAGEFIAIHELTHAIGTDYMRNMVENYRKSNKEFDNAVKSLLENYNATELTDEAMADVSAQLLGNQEYINNLSMTNPNLFQRIYNEIKYLWHQFRGYTNQNQFINDLQYKWEQAYRNNNNFNESENYSIAGRQSLENIKNDTNTYNQGINSYNTALNLANKNVNNEDIRKQTGWFQDKNEDWKYEISDKDMSLKSNVKLENDKTYKLKEILKHDTLFTLYPSLENLEVEITNKKGYSGNYNQDNKKITLNSKNISNQKVIESTLIHEIQHAIQDIEGFETGITSKLSKKAYYENLGEIEADDVSKRFVDEKYKNVNINNIAPESSKNNPKHRKYDKYMQQRGTVDKIKDSVFKYPKKDGNSYEISQENLEQANNETIQDGNEEIWNRLKNKNSEKGSFNLSKNNQKRLNELKSIDTSNMGFIERGKIKTEIRALEQGYNSIEEYKQAEQEKVKQAKEEYEQRQKARKDEKKQKQIQLEKDIKESTPLQNAQFEIIQNTNPMLDDYHTGIRSPKDIKTFDEVINDEESFVWGDFSREDAEQALKKGKVTIYSSYPIENGTFVSTSKVQAEDYAGGRGKKIYSKEVPLQEVAWINGDEGQYAKVKNNEINKLTDNGITMTYVRKPNTNTKNYGTTYGQNLEPSGEYMSMDTLKGEYKVPGFEYGTITFKKPLVIEHKDTTDKGWKKDLSEKYNGLTGKKLSNAIKKDGYDAIMTRDEDGNFVEIINLNGIKNDTKYSKNNQNWQQYLEKNFQSKGTRTNLKEIRQIAPIGENVKRQSSNINNAEKADETEKIANILEKPPEKVKRKDRTIAILKANLIDKGMVFEELSRKTNNRELQGKYDYTLSSGARGQYAIGNARYDYQTVMKDGKVTKGNKDAKQISKSLTDIIDEVGENPTDFYNYMYHQLNIDRMTLEDRFGGDTGLNYNKKETVKNKPVFGEKVTADISRKIVSQIEQKHPEFKSYAKDVYDYLDANMQELVNNGVISEELRQKLKERYPHYVPVSRVNDKGLNINVPLDTNRMGINTPLKRAKGGNQDIKPLFQTIADRTLQTYRASARNNFGVELKNTLQKANLLNQNMEITDIDSIIENMADETQNKELLKEGKNGENPTFTVFENGEKITYEISQDMYDALKPKNELLNNLDNTKLSKVARKISNFRRGVLTEYNPIFSITNALKDAQDVLINSQHAKKTYAKFPEAYSQILNKGYWYNEYTQNGGEQNSYFTEGDFENIKKSNISKVKNVLTFPLQKISDINNVIELAPRLAEYIASRENGASIEVSMLDSARVTTNFKAGGDITKFINRNGGTFLNASVQGFQQQVRNIQEANAKGLKGWTNLALKYTVAGLPALILNNLFWKDDDDYEQLQDYVKDNYYVVAKLPNGNFLRVPKGRMVATIQKVVSNADKFITKGKINDDDVAQTIWKDLKNDISFGADNLAPNNPVTNNILSPIIDVINNKTWYGDDLVPSRLQKVPTKEQYDETTDKFSKWLGEKINVSPKKINYLLDQYGGGVSDILLPIGTPQAENNVIEDKFTTDPIMKSQYPTDFFNKVDELNVNSNSLNATDEDKVKYKYISSIQEEVSKLYKQKREIQASAKSDEEKKKEIKQIQKQINKYTQEGVGKLESTKVKDNTATVGNKEYYKYNNGWKELTDEEKEKNKNISLKTYADYKNKLYKITQNKKEDEESIKANDKIQILLDSNYSSKEKSALYENYIGAKDTLYSDILSKNNIDIDKYLKYKVDTSSISADKDEDGKSISGSSKQKYYDYVNKNITGYENRLLILGSKYKLSDTERKSLAEYINKNYSRKELLDVYGMLDKNFTVKNGKVYYK